MKHNNIKISPQLTIEQRFAGLLKQNKKKSATIHPQVEDNETILKSTHKILATLENNGFKYRWYHNIYETKSIKEAKNFLKSIASERPEIIANIADLKEITSRYKFNKIDDKLFFASKYIESQEKSKQETQVKPKIVTNIEFAEILDTLKINDSEERFSATLEIIDKNNFSYINRENFLNNDFDKIINKNDDIFNFKKLKIAKKFIKNSQKDNEINKIPNFIDFIKNADIDGNKPYFIRECLSELLNINIDQNKNLTISDEDISLLINNIQKNKGDKKSIAIQILQRQINDENTIDANNAKYKILKMMKHLNNDSKSLNLSTTNNIEAITPIAFFNYRGTARYSIIKETKDLFYKEFYSFEQLILKNDKIKTIDEFSILTKYLPNFNQETQLINLLSLSNNLISRAKPIEKASNEIIDKIAIKDIKDQEQQELKNILKKFLKTEKNIKDKDIKDLAKIFSSQVGEGNITKFKNFMINNIDKVCFLLTEDKEDGFNKFNGIISSLKDGCGANISNQLNLVINSLNIQNNDDGKYAEPIRLVTAKIIEEIIIPLTHNSRADTLGAGFAASLMQEPFLARYFITPNCLFNKILSIVNYGKNIHLIDKDEYSAVKESTAEKATESDDYSNIEILGKKLIAFEIMKEIFKDSEKQNSKFDSLIPNSFELKELQKTIEEANQQKEKENLIKDQEVTPNNNINPSSPIFNRHEKLLVKLQKQNII